MLTIAAITLIAGTVHLNSDMSQSREYRDVNPGIVMHLNEVATGCSPSLGVYANSISKTSVLAACKWSKSLTDTVSVSALGGVLTGYNKSVIPFAAPTISYGALNLTYLPSPAMAGMRSGAQGVNVSFTFNLK